MNRNLSRRRVVFEILTIVIFLLLTGHNVYPQQEDYRTSLLVLFDTSQTFFNDQTKPRLSKVLDTINSGIWDFSTVSDTPLKIFFLGVYDLGLNRPPIAVATYQRKLFGCKKDALCKPDDLVTWLNLVKKLMLAKETANYTDISGSVYSGSLLVSGQERGEKSMLIISDCKEERRAGSVVPTLNLQGFNIVIIYMPLNEDAMEPKRLSDRLNYWRATLMRAKASKVTFLHIDGITPAQITKGLKK